MKPISLEVVTKVVTFFDQCRQCQILYDQAGLDQKFHQHEMDEYPPDFKEEYAKLSDWIRELLQLYKHRLLIRVIDVQSPVGIYKSLRHRIRTYPTFIINGKDTYTGWDKSRLETLLDKYFQKAYPSKHRHLQPSHP